ncbi:MAG: GNAT family N-acetyltransferase [Thermomicrobiales bacterium]|nr:GNAT family N-acetyltransferase [Thermomicrobiales bacterium]
MHAMIARWLRRRLGVRVPDVEANLSNEDRKRGSLVRKGRLVALRTHVTANREAFQRWYADPEIAALLRHDLEPLNEVQSRGYFDSFILPASARGVCFAIHERKTHRLIGTTALTDRIQTKDGPSALFRIVIGEKDLWGRGYGTEATSLVMEEGFDALGLSEIRLEVFAYNARAIAAYRRVGFVVTGEHVEWVPRRKTELRVVEMRLTREAFEAQKARDAADAGSRKKARAPKTPGEERDALRTERKAQRRAARAQLDAEIEAVAGDAAATD